MSSSLLLERTRAVSKLICRLIFERPMGGGPRTFPGGLNKWQWKRMHEKRAKEKEKKLLAQEKQLYQARIRSQIRAKLAGKPESSVEMEPSTTHEPMSPSDHIKALANRFMKEGAIDLWNEADGPLTMSEGKAFIESSGRSRSISSPIDVRKLIADKRFGSRNYDNVNFGNLSANYVKGRNYSFQRQKRFSRNESSSSDEDEDYSSEDDSVKAVSQKSARNVENSSSINLRHTRTDRKILTKRGLRFDRNESSTREDDSSFHLKEDSGKPFARNSRWPRVSGGGQEEFQRESEGSRNGKDVRIGGRGSLGKYDIKTKRRVIPKPYDEESDFAEQIDIIRHELSKKNAAESREEKSEESILTEKRFDQCGISPLTVQALSAAGYVQMTRVQEASLPIFLEGKDAVVKAKTGTGKSAAFLLPAIETVSKAMSSSTNMRVPPIYVLIICPTRELASQLAAEANVMVKYHEGIGVQTLVGGTRFKDDQKRLESNPSQIVVATPGRLLDHVESKSSLSVRLMALKMLILDEADHLLDLGFRKDMERIVDCLPRQRQSLLFSATIPKEVRRISQLVLKREHVYLDTVGLGCVETHPKVKQSYLIAPHELHFQIVYHILKEHTLQMPDYKVIVFCTTGMLTSLMFTLLREMKMSVREIHSRKPQLYRTRISEEFKQSNRLILVTSDVSSRGMNYPDVTLVIQMGIPSDREQYIHRLGRTGREGKEGEGILLIAPWEEYFLGELKNLPLQKLPVPRVDLDSKLKIENSMEKIDSSVKEGAYHAWLGYYNSIREIGRDKTTLVELANKFSDSIGLQNPPSLFRKTIVKMGLRDIPGIKIRK